jgi:hypothetical protein
VEAAPGGQPVASPTNMVVGFEQGQTLTWAGVVGVAGRPLGELVAAARAAGATVAR